MAANDSEGVGTPELVSSGSPSSSRSAARLRQTALCCQPLQGVIGRDSDEQRDLTPAIGHYDRLTCLHQTEDALARWRSCLIPIDPTWYS